MPTMLLVAATEEAHRELPIPAMWFGIIALTVFASLFGLTWAFRSVATRH